MVEMTSIDWTKAFENKEPKSRITVKYRELESDNKVEEPVTEQVNGTSRFKKLKLSKPTIIALSIATPIAFALGGMYTGGETELIQAVTQAVEPVNQVQQVQNIPQVVEVTKVIQQTSDVALNTATSTQVANAVTTVTPDTGWDRLIGKVLFITDYLMRGVIIFSGVSWMFGNRTKAIELMFGAGVGYTIIRHHEDIKNFFALL